MPAQAVAAARDAQGAWAAMGLSARQVCLGRLADGAYDMVVVDGDPAEAADYVEQAVRMLRPGGVLAVTSALAQDRVADPARRDEATVAARELGKAVRENALLLSALLPVGDGLLVAVRR